MENKKCTVCGSEKIMSNLRIRDRYELNQGGDLEVVIPRKPNALLFKDLYKEALQATVCGECGDVRLSVSNPKGLWQVYVQSEQRKNEI